MTNDERRLRFLRNWYAAHGAAGQISVTQNLMSRVMTGTNTSRGITFTYQSNGSILVKGTATGGTAYSNYIPFRLEPGTYKKSPYINNIGLTIQYRKDSSNLVVISISGSETPFTITPEISQYDIVARVSILKGYTINNIIYEPYIVRV